MDAETNGLQLVRESDRTLFTGNQAKLAEWLGISRQTLNERVTRHGGFARNGQLYIPHQVIIHCRVSCPPSDVSIAGTALDQLRSAIAKAAEESLEAPVREAGMDLAALLAALWNEARDPDGRRKRNRHNAELLRVVLEDMADRLDDEGDLGLVGKSALAKLQAPKPVKNIARQSLLGRALSCTLMQTKEGAESALQIDSLGQAILAVTGFGWRATLEQRGTVDDSQEVKRFCNLVLSAVAACWPDERRWIEALLDLAWTLDWHYPVPFVRSPASYVYLQAYGFYMTAAHTTGESWTQSTSSGLISILENIGTEAFYQRYRDGERPPAGSAMKNPNRELNFRTGILGPAPGIRHYIFDRGGIEEALRAERGLITRLDDEQKLKLDTSSMLRDALVNHVWLEMTPLKRFEGWRCCFTRTCLGEQLFSFRGGAKTIAHALTIRWRGSAENDEVRTILRDVERRIGPTAFLERFESAAHEMGRTLRCPERVASQTESEIDEMIRELWGKS